jgi:hypothetical protein
MKYKIRQLKWEGKIGKESWMGNLTANTSLGNFHINLTDEKENKYMWDYCFDEYYDENHFYVKTIKQAKEDAQKYFEQRAIKCLNDFLGITN